MKANPARLKLLSSEGDAPAVGILKLQISIGPKRGIQLVPERSLQDHLAKEKKFRDVDMLKFYEYSANWWNEFKSIDKTFEQRNVKIYAESEDGQFLPVFCFVKPLDMIQGIETPYHASRFVSLIPLTKHMRPGGEKLDIWQRFHSMLAVGAGEVEDHCNLLCSMLLGFGLDAYVVIGTNLNDHHAWVMTRTEDSIYFWESVTGAKFSQSNEFYFLIKRGS